MFFRFLVLFGRSFFWEIMNSLCVFDGEVMGYFLGRLCVRLYVFFFREDGMLSCAFRFVFGVFVVVFSIGRFFVSGSIL